MSQATSAMTVIKVTGHWAVPSGHLMRGPCSSALEIGPPSYFVLTAKLARPVDMSLKVDTLFFSSNSKHLNLVKKQPSLSLVCHVSIRECRSVQKRVQDAAIEGFNTDQSSQPANMKNIAQLLFSKAVQ